MIFTGFIIATRKYSNFVYNEAKKQLNGFWKNVIIKTIKNALSE